jgi:hypothetical protein
MQNSTEIHYVTILNVRARRDNVTVGRNLLLMLTFIRNLRFIALIPTATQVNLNS